MDQQIPIQNSEAMYVNPFLVFFTIFILPYLIFFMLMMFITGYTDPTLILESVIEKRGVEFIKIWVIGSFAMSIIATILISGAGITHIIKKGSKKTTAFAGGSIEVEGMPQADDMPIISKIDENGREDRETGTESDPSLFEAKDDHEDIYENETSRVFIVTPGADTADAPESQQTKKQKKRYNMLDKYVSEKNGQ